MRFPFVLSMVVILCAQLLITVDSWGLTKRIRITPKNSARVVAISELDAFRLKGACYKVSQSVSLLGVIERHYFIRPVRKVNHRRKDRKSKKIALFEALKEARQRCGTPTPTPSPTPSATPSPSATPPNTPLPTATPDVTATSTPTATPSPTPSPSASPSPSPTFTPLPIPLLSQWETQMYTYGTLHCQNLNSSSLTFDQKLAATYYDAEWVFYQIGDYTGDNSWYSCAQAAEGIYADNYVAANSGNVPGYWNFGHGVTKDYLETGDNSSRDAAVLLSTNAAYTPDWTPLSWTEDANMSREVAYAIMSYLNAEKVGAPHRDRCELLVAQALDHLDQWFVSETAEYVRPFMFALTAHALISYDEYIGGSSAIRAALINGANWIWNHTWLPGSQAFMYTDRVVPSGGMEPAPDLNLLIAPVYAWIWHQTGNEIFRDRADQIFAGGVNGAYLVNGKQFNQNYRWSFDYIKWRSLPPLQ